MPGPLSSNTSRSIVPLLKKPTATWDFPAVTTHGFRNHAVRTEAWRYIRYANGDEELYDHRKDPYEFTNLAGNPAFKAVIGQLKAALPTSNAPHKKQTAAKKKKKK